MNYSSRELRKPRRICAYLPKKCISCGKRFWLKKGWKRYLGLNYFGRSLFVHCCEKGGLKW